MLVAIVKKQHTLWLMLDEGCEFPRTMRHCTVEIYLIVFAFRRKVLSMVLSSGRFLLCPLNFNFRPAIQYTVSVSLAFNALFSVAPLFGFAISVEALYFELPGQKPLLISSVSR